MPDEKNINPHKEHRQRMKRQFIRVGMDVYEPHQVLEMLLFYAIPQRDTNPIAHRLLDRFGDLPSVLDADYEELCKVKGVSEHTATLLVLCGQLLSRYHKEKTKKTRFTAHSEIVEFLEKQLLNEKREKVLLLSLNNRAKFINCTTVYTGTLTSSEANTRELVQTALLDQATAVVVAHNHPVGYALPSEEDIATTQAFLPAFKMMQIKVLDHVIVSPNGSYSMRESPYYAPLFTEVITRLDKQDNKKD